MDSGWKTKTLITGLVVGALTGLGAAYLVVSRSQEKDEPPTINAADRIRLALLLLGLVRQIGEFGAVEKE